jgi:hypothetical protein
MLRHTFITRLVQAGRSLPEIAMLADHRNIVTTMRYVHVAAQYLREGIRVLESNMWTGTHIEYAIRHSVRISMEKCWDCQKEFPTSQGRKAHQKTCKQRHARLALKATLGSANLREPVPQAAGFPTSASTPAQQAQNATSDVRPSPRSAKKHIVTLHIARPLNDGERCCKKQKRPSSISIGAPLFRLPRK